MRARYVGEDPYALAGLKQILGELGLEPVELDEEAVVWDVGRGGLDAPEGAVLALARDVDGARAALAAGASGVLARDGDPARIAAAVAAVAAGLRVLDERFDALLDLGPREEGPDEPLTAREQEVLELLAAGLSNRLIGRRLGTSEHTVKFHVNALLQKLAAKNRTDAVVKATRMGLLTL